MEDPLPVPASLEQEVLAATFRLHNIVLTGLRDYQVKLVQVDLKGHEVSLSQEKPDSFNNSEKNPKFLVCGAAAYFPTSRFTGVI